MLERSFSTPEVCMQKISSEKRKGHTKIVSIPLQHFNESGVTFVKLLEQALFGQKQKLKYVSRKNKILPYKSALTFSERFRKKGYDQIFLIFHRKPFREQPKVRGVYNSKLTDFYENTFQSQINGTFELLLDSEQTRGMKLLF